MAVSNNRYQRPLNLRNFKDPRADRGNNHSLIDMVGVVLCGTICGADTWADIERFCKAHRAWFEEFLELPYGVPFHAK
jgi:hypothetical protein